MLKPEDAEKVLIKNLANVIRKANTGKPLTAAERALIEEAAAGGTLQDTGSAFAKTYDELAQRFGLTRKTLQNASKRFPEEVPKARADGRHDVAAWSQFLIKHNIARTAENIASAPSDEASEGPVTVTDWKAREVQLKCTKLELENCKVAGELVDAAEVETGTSAMVQAFAQALNNLVPRLAQKILGTTDYHEAEEIIQGEVDVVKKALQRCEFLAPASPAPDHETRFGDTLTTECVSNESAKRERAAVVGKQPRDRESLSKSGSAPVKGTPKEASRKGDSKGTRVPSGKSRCVKRPPSNQKTPGRIKGS
ncbi:hypothetical protein [Prosthecobacter sp.]|uniref:hypothetical protein n=1 Tax=Prosthecobacter sp. TaxID=1965333 RepID=UPI00378336B6